MKRSILVLIIAVIVVIILGGVWYLYASNSGTVPNQAANIQNQQGPGNTSTATNQNSVIGNNALAGSSTPLSTASSSKVGAYIVAVNGMTLYAYAKDTPIISNCSGQCAVTWPPYIVSSKSQLSDVPGMSGKIGELTRPDGSVQVIYNGQPLYLYVKDIKPGDVNGQGVGGLWHVVKP